MDWGALNKHFSRDAKQRLWKLGYALRRYYNPDLNDEGVCRKFVARGDVYARLYQRLRAEMNEYHPVYRGEANRVKALLLAKAKTKAASRKDDGSSEGTEAGAMVDGAVN